MENTKLRLGMYKKIAIARKQLPYMTEEVYRTTLVSRYGQDSAKKLKHHELADLLQFFARAGAVFTSKGSNKKVKASARPDWIEITDTMLFANHKRQILLIWRKLEYSMTSLNTRVKREYQVECFIWLHEEHAIKSLLTDLQHREKAFDNKKKVEGDAM